jgi:hypothetical protein
VTIYKLANLPRWAAKVEKIADAVVSQSVNDLLSGIRPSIGINRGGTRERGTIPRDIGALINSLQSTLYGGTAIVGPASYVLVAGRMGAGSRASFAWGGTVAPYAAAVHYGANGVKGTFWVDVAANKWPRTVRGALRKVKAAIK